MVCRYDCRYVKVRFKFPWMVDFTDLHFIFWLFFLDFCIVYNLAMNSEFENVRKKVLNWQSSFKSIPSFYFWTISSKCLEIWPPKFRPLLSRLICSYIYCCIWKVHSSQPIFTEVFCWYFIYLERGHLNRGTLEYIYRFVKGKGTFMYILSTSNETSFLSSSSTIRSISLCINFGCFNVYSR